MGLVDRNRLAVGQVQGAKQFAAATPQAFPFHGAPHLRDDEGDHDRHQDHDHRQFDEGEPASSDRVGAAGQLQGVARVEAHAQAELFPVSDVGAIAFASIGVVGPP